MRSCLQTVISFAVACCACSLAYAGPNDVRFGDEPVLKPNQKLELPMQPRQLRPLPAPPAPVVQIQSGQISISETRSLLASFGVREPQELGFRSDVWQYLPANKAKTFVAALKLSNLAALNRRLAQLMQLRASAPDGAQADWFGLRLQALRRLNKPDLAKAMLEATPASLLDELNGAERFTLLASELGAQAGCEAIEGRSPPVDVKAAQWQRLSLFCSALGGNFAPVELAQSIAEERGAPLQSWFVQLLEQMQYQTTQAQLPSLPDHASAVDAAMLASLSVGNDVASGTAVAKPFPRKPAYAMMAIARLIREDKLDETDQWLRMLDRQSSNSAASFVAHELVRFLKTDPHQPRSEAANSLPPFTATEKANKADVALLRRFYGVMERFEYTLPAPTIQWLAQQPAPKPSPVGASALTTEAQAGDVAGYLLQLSGWLSEQPLKKLSMNQFNQRIDELLYLRERALAQRLAAEAVLTQL